MITGSSQINHSLQQALKAITRTVSVLLSCTSLEIMQDVFEVKHLLVALPASAAQCFQDLYVDIKVGKHAFDDDEEVLWLLYIASRT